MRDASLVAYPGWIWLLPGLFAQGGVAEEALFRGYLFGRLRRGRSFWHAAALAAVPFVLVHLYLFATLPWPVALASVLLATIISFPLSHLFELGGNTIWSPALLHFTVQGAIKVLEVPGEAAVPVVWMVASAAIPSLALLFQRPTVGIERNLTGRCDASPSHASALLLQSASLRFRQITVLAGMLASGQRRGSGRA